MRAQYRNSSSSRQLQKSPAIRGNPALALLAAVAVLALGVAAPACATDFLVSDAGDSGPGTLRQAVLDANAASGPHTITFALPPGTTIGLTSGDIEFTGPDVTLQGPGRNALTLSGSHNSRIFDVQAGSLTVNDMTLRDGLALGDATNLYDEVGGAIRVSAVPAAKSAQFSTQLVTARAHARSGNTTSARSLPSRSAGFVPAQLAQSQRENAGPPAFGLTLDHVDLLDNRAEAPDAACGGAIYVSGGTALVVRNSRFDGNSTPFAGGAICAIGGNDLASPLAGAGSFDISDSSFSANHIDQNGTEPGQGAGIITAGPGGSIRRSIFRDNAINDAPPEDFSEGIGGALTLILADLPITIDGTEISENTIALRPDVFSEGAGLYCEGHAEIDATTPLAIINSTISNNLSDSGAAIEDGCNLQVFNSTIADNFVTNTHGDAGVVEIIYDEGKFSATSALIFNPASPADLYVFRGVAGLGTISASLIFAPDPSTPPLPPDTIIGVDPLLAPLANNGGPSRTHALQSGSVAIDAGSNPQVLASDQRGSGFTREIGVSADIGAFESDADRILTNGFD
jgi:hypothetical protein